ncbi:MAG TPA: hypothetical protein P5534_19520 [Candidatus Paceibacterota bacterium]|nr:hypothetical protein [Candidatus Paceibacterota bacterium]HRZ58038.1 hypothetical protein [Candidatus Paceibacterota bacterium]
METQFAGIAQLLQRLSVSCRSEDRKPLNLAGPELRLLVVPPPTGTYDPPNECWRRDPTTLFETDEIRTIIRFLNAGGRLLVFGYRFGDSFTQTNLGQLINPLGCLLNDDAIVDLHRLQHYYPLECYFETQQDLVPVKWAAAGVDVLRWRSMATFTILPGSPIRPLALSPGGSCISYDRTHRQISFQSHPVAVAGTHGAGRFALFGGPHPFETSRLGLLGEASNARFLENVLRWLLTNDSADLDATNSWAGSAEFDIRDAAQERWREYGHIESVGNGAEAVAFVENLLRETDTLRALSLPKWQA